MNCAAAESGAPTETADGQDSDSTSHADCPLGAPMVNESDRQHNLCSGLHLAQRLLEQQERRDRRRLGAEFVVVVRPRDLGADLAP